MTSNYFRKASSDGAGFACYIKKRATVTYDNGKMLSSEQI
jgi:hypothetical protein